MATYAIGDVQGCCDQLTNLLTVINFDRAKDKLIFLGDVVNRGPKSLDTLRLIKSLAPSVRLVLGNHDLHLLACYAQTSTPEPGDTIDEILAADDGAVLCEWLRTQPLMIFDEVFSVAYVHAGVAPTWTRDEALSLAHEVSVRLQSDDYDDFLNHMYGNEPSLWSSELTGFDRLRFITNAFTRMRMVDKNGRLDLDFKLPARKAPPHLMPWFAMQNRPMANDLIVFGHWAALEEDTDVDNILPLDTGCVYGNKLTAYRFDDGQYFQVQGWSKQRG